jgi:hypothetical protein
MSTGASEAGTTTLTFNKAEKDELLQLLDAALGDLRVEIHHTHHTPDFRDQLLRREELLRGLIAKLRQDSP